MPGIRETLLHVSDSYGVARAAEFAGHPLAAFVRLTVPGVLASASADHGFRWHASAGQGGWADAPWFAVYDPLVTETAQEGYYPVYLFTRSLDAVHFSFNQGMTRLRAELGAEPARELLRARAAIIRARLDGEFAQRFSRLPIDLQATGAATRLAFYEPGHAFGTRYDRDSLPSEEVLVEDLREMLRLYRLLTSRGGTSELTSSANEDQTQADDTKLEEARRWVLHQRIERNRRIALQAKRIHGTRCQICGFSFGDHYGHLGRDFIEAHHRVPLSALASDRPVSLSPKADFAVVCANCHRMLHQAGAPERFEDFVDAYRQDAAGA